MKFLLLAHHDEKAWAALTKEEQDERVTRFSAYQRALRNEKALVAAYRPRPSSAARTVRVIGGSTRTAEGPLADAEEQLGGVYVIDVPDLDAALSWAARNPAAADGVVDVRPVWEPASHS